MRKLTYREIVREFLLFLKTEHVYKRYITLVKLQRKNEIKNWGNSINILTIPHIEKCFKGCDTLGCLIDRAFLWSDTEEGPTFWLVLHNKWCAKMADTEIVAEELTHK